jgi:hypothetical protein
MDEKQWSQIARRLFWLPFVCLIPTFFLVGKLVPNVTGGISDGFRKLNVFLPAMAYAFAISWLCSFAIVVRIEAPKMSKWQLLAWIGLPAVAVLVVFILIASGL